MTNIQIDWQTSESCGASWNVLDVWGVGDVNMNPSYVFERHPMGSCVFKRWDCAALVHESSPAAVWLQRHIHGVGGRWKLWYHMMNDDKWYHTPSHHIFFIIAMNRHESNKQIVMALAASWGFLDREREGTLCAFDFGWYDFHRRMIVGWGGPLGGPLSDGTRATRRATQACLHIPTVSQNEMEWHLL